MFTSKFLLSWFAYLVITFAMGFVWHLVAFKELYAKLGIYSRLNDPIIPLGITAMLIQGAVLAYLYPVVAKNGGWVLESVYYTIQFTLSGLAIAFIYS